jgi:hypothetical protein
MRKILITIFCFFCATAAYGEKKGACVELDRMGIVGTSIRAHADRVRGTHHCESRKHVERDINRDGEKDLLVTYAIEGACLGDKTSPPGTCGNHHEEFLSVFLKQKGKYKSPISRQVGGRGIRSIQGLSVKGSTIILDVLEYDDGDPSCCPSRHGKLKLRLADKKLVETT